MGTKKKISQYGLFILFLLVFQLCGNSQNFTSLKIDKSNFEEQNMLLYGIRKENQISINLPQEQAENKSFLITYTNDFSNYLNNSDELTQIDLFLENPNRLDNRPASIMATYWMTLSLLEMGSSQINQLKSKIETYLLECFNPNSQLFENEIDYDYYQQNFRYGSDLLKAPYCKEITHQMAIIILAKLGSLHKYFDQDQINEWIIQIWESQNLDDYGFGSINTGNSTLIETYFAVYTLLALNDFSITAISPLKIIQIKEFIESKQRTEDWAFAGIGMFSEYYPNEYLGWENYYASWLALRTIEMMEITLEPQVGQDFLDFIQQFDIYDNETNCFYGNWNEIFLESEETYYGTAIIGDCIRILGIESSFSNLLLAQETLLNASHFQNRAIKSGPNYFYTTDNLPICDPFVQYLILSYMNKSNTLTQFIDRSDEYQAVENYYLTFFTESGGASYYSNMQMTLNGQFINNSLRFVLNPEDIDKNAVFKQIMFMESITGDHFGNLINQSENQYELSNMKQYPWNEDQYYPIACNYYAIQLMQDLGLLNHFYEFVGIDYLDYEEWIANQITPNGYFNNDTRNPSKGNLKSTFYALKAQKILIDYNTGQSIENYYSPEIISTILDNCNQFVYLTENIQYVNISGSSENQGIGILEAAWYLIQINEILDNLNNLIDNNKFNNWILQQSSKIETFSQKEQGFAIQLLNYFELQDNQIFEVINHTKIRELCNEITSSLQSNKQDLEFLTILKKSNLIQIVIDTDEQYKIGQLITLRLEILSLTSIESIENIKLIETTQMHDSWYPSASGYVLQLNPSVSPTSPELWLATLAFSWHSRNYSGMIIKPVIFDWNVSLCVIENNIYYELNVQVETPRLIYEILYPKFTVQNNLGVQILDILGNKTQIEKTDENITYRFNLGKEILVENENYSLKCNFGYTWIDFSTFDLFLNNFSNDNSSQNNLTENQTNSSESVFDDNRAIWSGLIMSFAIIPAISIIKYKKKQQNEEKRY